jgi:hypothetical protein
MKHRLLLLTLLCLGRAANAQDTTAVLQRLRQTQDSTFRATVRAESAQLSGELRALDSLLRRPNAESALGRARDSNTIKLLESWESETDSLGRRQIRRLVLLARNSFVELNLRPMLEDSLSYPALAALYQQDGIVLDIAAAVTVDGLPSANSNRATEAAQYLARINSLFQRHTEALRVRGWTLTGYRNFERQKCSNAATDLLLFRMNFLRVMRTDYGIF